MKTLLSLILILGFNAAAAPMKPEILLQKISQRMTGQWPFPAEYARLQAEISARGCRTIDCLQTFFAAYIDEKMDTPQFASEATLKVFEKFSFQTPKVPPFPLDPGDASSNEDLNQTSRLIVYRMLHDNLPVDAMYTNQDLWMRRQDASGMGDFFADALNFPIDSATPPVITNVNALPLLGGITVSDVNYTGHPNVSGLFTTKKFLDRYWNTPVNGNRKRAAALYRTMLCDAMTPAIERDKAKAREEALAMGISEQQVSKRDFDEIHKNRHAHQEDCAKCHTRLDPVARSMRTLELGVTAFGLPGHLVFFDGVGRAVDIPANDFHDLTVKATQAETYSNCQLNFLFNWIVGRDVNLHPQRFEELLNDFEAGGRKFKTSISKLLLSPEFRGESKVYDEPESLKRARDVFSNCAECHGSFFKMRGSQLKLKLYKISGKLDLAHDGKDRKMPPAGHWWAPDAKDLQAVKTWILEGAPLVRGMQPLLDSTEVNTVINQTEGVR